MALLLLSGIACRGPDELAVSPWYGTGQSSWSNEGRDFSAHDSGLMLTVTWALGKRHAAYSNLAALDVSKAGQLTLRDDRHQPAAPIIIPTPGPQPDPTPVPPSWDWFAPFKRVPKTLEEALLLGIYMMTLVGGIVTLKRAGVLDRIIPSKKDPKP